MPKKTMSDDHYLLSKNLNHFLEEKALLQGWSEVGFSGSKDPEEKINQPVSIQGAGNIYIWNSYFNLPQGTGNGGVISFTSAKEESQMLVEFCVFENCHTSFQYGGAIFMAYSTTSGAGNCAINKCCATQCWSTASPSYGQFIRTYLTDKKTSLNKVLDSSVINSFPGSDSYGTIMLYNAKITINNANFSNNHCTYYPSVYCSPTVDIEVTSLLKFCSIRNIFGENRGVNLFSSAQQQIESSNLIENRIENNGLISSFSSVLVKGCTILENTVDVIFNSMSGSITVTNCSIDPNELGLVSGNVKFYSWQPKPKTFINPILPVQFTELCLASYDVIGTLTPDVTPPTTKPPTPKRTPNETPEMTPNKQLLKCYTWFCEDLRTTNVDILQILQYIFLLCCLPTNPAAAKWFC